MREILFRGKSTDNGKWIEGHYASQRKIIMDKESHYILTNGGYSGFGFSLNKIDPGTVGQYTGLIDKNGVKIFEGDIVEGLDYVPEDGGYGVVGFDDGAFEINGNNCLGTFHENYFGEDFEVVGNIHDNPELIGGRKWTQ